MVLKVYVCGDVDGDETMDVKGNLELHFMRKICDDPDCQSKPLSQYLNEEEEYSTEEAEYPNLVEDRLTDLLQTTRGDLVRLENLRYRMSFNTVKRAVGSHDWDDVITLICSAPWLRDYAIDKYFTQAKLTSHVVDQMAEMVAHKAPFGWYTWCEGLAERSMGRAELQARRVDELVSFLARWQANGSVERMTFERSLGVRELSLLRRAGAPGEKHLTSAITLASVETGRQLLIDIQAGKMPIEDEVAGSKSNLVATTCSNTILITRRASVPQDENKLIPSYQKSLPLRTSPRTRRGSCSNLGASNSGISRVYEARTAIVRHHRGLTPLDMSRVASEKS